MTRNEGISITLTVQDCNVFKDLCEEFLGTYKIHLNRSGAMALNRILDKIEEGIKLEKSE